MLRSWRGACGQVAVLAAAALLPACGDGTGPTPTVAALQPVSGDQQLVVVGTEAPLPLVVRAVDASGNPLAGQTINFRVLSGGGSLSGSSAVTDAQGQAGVRWTLGKVTADSQQVEAQAGTTGPTLVFRATARSGNPSTIAYFAGNGQTGAAGAVLPESLAVIVRDQYGNPAGGAVVSWAATTGGGTLHPAQSQTNAAGIARSAWQLGAAVGTQGAVAQTSQGSVFFGATATAPPPPGNAPQVSLDSAWIRDATRGFTGKEVAAIGQVSWQAGANPTIWFEWSESPSFSPINATPQVAVTRTDVTSIAFSDRLIGYTPGDPQKTIYYRIAAANQYGASRSAIKSFTTPPPGPQPGDVPENFRASFDASTMRVILEWEGTPANSVIIERRYSATDTTWYNIGQREGPPITWSSPAADVTFDVKETSAGAYRARVSCGDLSQCPWVYAPAVAIVPLAAPTGLSATLENGGVKLQWTDNSSNEYQFIVQRSPSPGKVLPANTTQYTDFAVVSGTTYHYYVVAIAVYRNYFQDSLSPVNEAARRSLPTNEVVVTVP
jgi:hypothetical protein